MTQFERFRTRSDISEVEIDAEREKELRAAFNNAEYGEQIQSCTAAVFEPDEPLEGSGVVLSSRLQHERIFDPISSLGSGKDGGPNTRKASATVRDRKTEEKLSVHLSQNHVLISLRSEDMSFESFRDYVLFLEQSLHVELSPVLE